MEVESLIFEFRGFRVMIDTDLASLYETETKKLKQQVRRNINRFPDDFMFELTTDEKGQLLEKAPRLSILKHSLFTPMVFSEQGVGMLSSVLHTSNAIQVNIEIMRSFAVYRAKLSENKDIRNEINSLDKKINFVFKFLLEKIGALTPNLEQKTHKRVGYRRRDE
ncbi:MAG: ORF6N domain-containing protein [Bacteroidales bacterium]|nr:ORF6N domain-containing protein [Bacteroidales bacterium]